MKGNLIYHHICFFNGTEENAKELVISLSKYPNETSITVLLDRDADIEILRSISGIEKKYTPETINLKITSREDYLALVQRLNTVMTDARNRNEEPILNLTGTTSIQAFAGRQATLQNSTESYILENGYKIEFPMYELPRKNDLNDTQVSIMKQLYNEYRKSMKREEGLPTISLDIQKKSKPLGKKGRKNAIETLLSLGLIELVKGTDKSRSDLMKGTDKSKRGPKPRNCILSNEGLTFCQINMI